MAFLRSSVLLGNVLENVQYRASYFIQRQVELSSVFTHRRYAKHAGAAQKAEPLDKKLKYMEDSARRGRYVSRRDAEELLHSIGQQRVSSFQYLQAFKFCGELLVEETPDTRAKLAHDLWKSLESGCVVDISHYNALLAVNVENEQPVSLEKTLAELKSRNLAPNRATFQRLLDYYARQGDLDGLTRTMEVMKTQEIPLNDTMYNSLILAHGFAGEKEKALQLASTMKDAGFEPTRETNIILLRVYAKYGDVAAILSEIERLDSEKKSVGSKDILDVVYDLTVNGHGSSCVQLFDLLNKGNNFARYAANTIIRLTQKGHEDVALQLLKIVPRKIAPSGGNYNSGGFFLQQLVKADCPLEKIVAICKELEAEGLHSNPLQAILPDLCDSGPSDLVWSLFRDRKARGETLIEENFRPLFNGNSVAAVQKSLRSMIQEFGIQPSTNFIKHVVLPKLNDETPEAALNKLITANVLPVPASLALATLCLQRNQLKDAADIIKHYKLSVPMQLFKPLLIAALKETNDVKSFVLLLRVHFEKRKLVGSSSAATLNEGADESIENDSYAKKSEDWGTLVVDTFAALPEKRRLKTIAAILKELVNQGVTITPQEAEQIRTDIQPSAEGTINAHLEQLASGDLELQPIGQSTLKIKATAFHLEKMLAGGKARNEIAVQHELMRAYSREGKTKEYEDFIQQLESKNVQIPGQFYAYLIKNKVEEKDLTSAVETITKIKAQNDKFFIFNDTVIGIIELYIENGQLNEALKFAAESRRITENEDGDFADSSVRCRKLLNRLADEGKETELNQIFESLVENGLVKVSNRLLGPLVKVHLVNDNLNKAVETFEKLAKQYKETPLKGAILVHLIRRGEFEFLQKVVDISATVHNEHSVLTDLALCFVECDELTHAHRVFEMPNLYLHQQEIWTRSAKYNKDGSIELLEKLAAATRGVKSFKREPIYLNLLDLYIRKDESDKALQLWVTLQEENEVASDKFLKKLGAYLKSKKIDVPFEIPEDQQKKANETKTKPKPSNNETAKEKGKTTKGKGYPVGKPGEKVYDFIGMLDKATSSEVNEHFQQLSESDLAEILEKISGTKRLVKLFTGLGEAGNLSDLEKVNSLLPKAFQGKNWFQDGRVKACAASGQANEWLEEWNKKLDEATTAEALYELEQFPCGGFHFLIEHNEQLFAKCETLARKYVEKNIFGPISVIWCHHLINGNKESAQKVWDEYLQNSSTIYYRSITGKAFENNDDGLINNLIEYLQSSENTKDHVAGAYNSLVRIYIRKNQLDDALNVFGIMKKGDMAIDMRVTLKLRAAMKAEGKVFPYESEKAKQ